ncbi:MAG TPA: response regulator [Burkholderiales bacterium]|nr:response regulator [Burkholderiales bacterium]
MASTTGCVSIVDDDGLVLRALDRLLQSQGFDVDTFSSPRDFLDHPAAEGPGCVVMDLSMPGLSGLDLQQALAAIGDERPVVFISGSASISAGIAAMKAGAVDFLTKPFDPQQLLAAVRTALEKHRAMRATSSAQTEFAERLGSLTPREREVLEGVVAGRLNKQIADRLGTAEKTVKVHRARMMEKMQVASVAELVRAWTLAHHGGGAVPS